MIRAPDCRMEGCGSNLIGLSESCIVTGCRILLVSVVNEYLSEIRVVITGERNAASYRDCNPLGS